MADPRTRRGILGGLARLPLIGGSVTLLGTPTRAAVPISAELIDTYVTWLAHEHRAAIVEQARRKAERRVADLIRGGEPPIPGYVASVVYDARLCPHMFWFPDHPPVEAIVAGADPSTRAAVVLSAVGCDWTCRRQEARS